MSLSDVSGTPARSGRVLLVDDEADLCRAYARVLVKAGLTVQSKPLTGSLIAGVGAGGQSVAHVRISSRRPSREARAA